MQRQGGVCACFADGYRLPQDGEVPLISAADIGHVQVVQELLGKGANIEAQDNVRVCFVNHAVLCGRFCLFGSFLRLCMCAKEREREAESASARETGFRFVVECVLV
jgi:ankyrin repeat protein